MEPKLSNGDYIPDGLGGVARCAGADALLERVLFRLTARREQFAPLPQLGSRLYLLGRESAANRLSAAWQYAAEALAEEDVEITNLTLSPAGEGRMDLAVYLDYKGTDLSVTMTI